MYGRCNKLWATLLTGWNGFCQVVGPGINGQLTFFTQSVIIRLTHAYHCKRFERSRDDQPGFFGIFIDLRNFHPDLRQACRPLWEKKKAIRWDIDLSRSAAQ